MSSRRNRKERVSEKFEELKERKSNNDREKRAKRRHNKCQGKEEECTRTENEEYSEVLLEGPREENCNQCQESEDESPMQTYCSEAVTVGETRTENTRLSEEVSNSSIGNRRHGDSSPQEFKDNKENKGCTPSASTMYRRGMKEEDPEKYEEWKEERNAKDRARRSAHKQKWEEEPHTQAEIEEHEKKLEQRRQRSRELYYKRRIKEGKPTRHKKAPTEETWPNAASPVESGDCTLQKGPSRSTIFRRRLKERDPKLYRLRQELRNTKDTAKRHEKQRRWEEEPHTQEEIEEHEAKLNKIKEKARQGYHNRENGGIPKTTRKRRHPSQERKRLRDDYVEWFKRMRDLERSEPRRKA